MPEIHKIIQIALFTAFIILFLERTGLKQKMIDFFAVKKLMLLTKLLECDFCLSFWVASIISICYSLILNDPLIMLSPIFTTPLTRYIL